MSAATGVARTGAGELFVVHSHLCLPRNNHVLPATMLLSVIFSYVHGSGSFIFCAFGWDFFWCSGLAVVLRKGFVICNGGWKKGKSLGNGAVRALFLGCGTGSDTFARVRMH